MNNALSAVKRRGSILSSVTKNLFTTTENPEMNAVSMMRRVPLSSDLDNFCIGFFMVFVV